LFATVKDVRNFAVAYIIPPFLVYHVVDGIDIFLFNKDLAPGQGFEELCRCQQAVIIGVISLEGAHQRKLTACLFKLVAHARKYFGEFDCFLSADF
jgi:hypothetical protein